MACSLFPSQLLHTTFRHSLRSRISSSGSVTPRLFVPQLQRLQRSSRRFHASPAHMSSGWSYLDKHPDEEKPPLPYHAGAIISARAWDLPDNEQIIMDHIWAEGQLKELLQDEHPLETCLRYTEATDAPLQDERIELHVVDEISVMDGAHSQIAKVKIIDRRMTDEKKAQVSLPPPDMTVAAKFYDPLYLDIEDEVPDMFRNTYNAFYRESCVYKQLKPLWGTVVPRFYGTLRAKVPVPGGPTGGRLRYVYAILYEYAPGATLDDCAEKVVEWSQAERMKIMKQLIDADSWIRQAGIYQRDLEPRNVVLHGGPGQQHPVSVRIIDFDYAYIEWESDPDDELQPEPPSEIVDRWLNKLLDPKRAFEWLIDWPFEEWLQREYLR